MESPLENRTETIFIPGQLRRMPKTGYDSLGIRTRRYYLKTASTFETADLQLRDMDTSGQYSDLYDNGRWRNIDEAMRLIQFHPEILLDSHNMAKDGGLAIVQGIKDGIARIVRDGSYKKDTPIEPAGTSTFHMAP
jgi:hypothetical protein